MKRRTAYIMYSIIIIISIYFIFLRNLDEKILKQRGKVLILKIEQYRSKEGILPNGFYELDLQESNTNEIFYQRVDTFNYILWFGTSLGESIIYYSDSKEWEEGYRPMKE